MTLYFFFAKRHFYFTFWHKKSVTAHKYVANSFEKYNIEVCFIVSIKKNWCKSYLEITMTIWQKNEKADTWCW